MRALLTIAVLLFTVSAFAVEPPRPSPSPDGAGKGEPPAAAASQATIAIGLSDGGEYHLSLARNGTPTTLTVRQGGDEITIHLSMSDLTRVRYVIQRKGARSFSLDGETTPPRGRPAVVGHFPFGDGALDVRLRMTLD